MTTTTTALPCMLPTGWFRIPYENRPNRGRRVQSYPVAELNDSIYVWHGADGFYPAPEHAAEPVSHGA